MYIKKENKEKDICELKRKCMRKMNEEMYTKKNKEKIKKNKNR